MEHPLSFDPGDGYSRTCNGRDRSPARTRARTRSHRKGPGPDGRRRGLARHRRGARGIGKSALLAAVRATAAAGGVRVLRARGAELERDFAFGVVRQLFEPALAETDPADRADLFGGHAGLAGELLGLPGAPVTGDAPGAGARPDPSFAVLHGLYWLCANLSASGPVLLCVDDAHWADTSSLRFLSFLAPRLEELCVTLLVGVRSGETGAASDLVARLAVEPAADVIHPAPLTRVAVGRLLEDGLGHHARPGVRRRLRGGDRRHPVPRPPARDGAQRGRHRPDRRGRDRDRDARRAHGRALGAGPARQHAAGGVEARARGRRARAGVAAERRRARRPRAGRRRRRGRQPRRRRDPRARPAAGVRAPGRARGRLRGGPVGPPRLRRTAARPVCSPSRARRPSGSPSI